jgi:MFS family permease
MLLTGRVIQALGGGGIMPIANAEFGTTFPKEKRGMALGLVGAAFGIANILGSTIGSAILNMLGNENWRWLFFINIPICIIIVSCGLFILPNSKADFVKKIDKFGTFIMVGIILSLLYGLKNIDFFDFRNSISSTSVYPYLIIFACLIPLLIFIERRAEDPVLNLDYFSNTRILVVLILSIISGIGMMGMVFVPQFAENALKIKTGTGGYFVAILGIFAGVSAPVSGKLIDKFGAKLILLIGFAISMAGALFLAFVAVRTNTISSVCIGLILMGLGVGFTMGTPLNYMMLDNTKKEDSNSALATLSLIRSVGTAVSPAIMIGFIAHAGLSVQSNLMKVMPQTTMPKITQMEELKAMINTLKSDAKTADMLKNVTLPDLNQPANIKMNMADGTLPNDLLKKVQNSDVTNITEISEEIAERMYDKNVPQVISKIQNGTQAGIDGMQKGIDGISKGEADLNKGISGVTAAIAKMQIGLNGMTTAVSKMNDALNQQDAALAQMNKLKDSLKNNSEVKMPIIGMPATSMPAGNMPSSSAMDVNTLNLKIQQLTSARNQLSDKTNQTKQQKWKLEKALKETTAKKQQMADALSKMNDKKVLMVNAMNTTKELKESIPLTFEKAKEDYLKSIEARKPQIQEVFQSTLNVGFKQMYLTVFYINLLAFIVLLFYNKPSTSKIKED